ncbi:MAG: Hsp70 family protein [Oscillospiraceae bacterium]|nr:Hsp70 family protein [Oscillospiraceae bacterium]
MSETTTTTFGIDLGTTYSCISYLKDGHPTVCVNVEGERTTPSVVRMLTSDPEPVVGKTAKDTSIIYPDDTIQFVKSKIGKVETFEIGDESNRRTVSPVQVSAEILKKLAADASQYTGMTVKDVCITVPAYFGNNEKAATKQAGIDAGLNVISIVEEPTAAAFYYLCERDDTDATVCVYDLGGGTFDVTALEKKGTEIRVLTTQGDHDLGGKNWDAELISYVESKFREETNLDPEEELDVDFIQDLQLKCEEAKKQLTFSQTASIAMKLDNKHKANITVTREEFEDITSALLQTSIDLTSKVFDEVEASGKKIDKLLLVGGSSIMPQVNAAVQEAFGSRVDEILVNDPNESVSKGACIFCAWSLLHSTPTESSESGEATLPGEVIGTSTNEETGETIITLAGTDGGTREVVVPTTLGGSIKDIITIATKSFGIQTFVGDEEKITNLIIKDQQLPATFEQEFGTHTDNMKDVSIVLYQSEVKDTTCDMECGTLICESVLSGLPDNLPKNSPVLIHIELSKEGIIDITGSYQGTPLEGCLNTSYAEGVGTKN